MTATTILEPGAGDGPLHCYRHPDRETYLRCGRCDQPICTRCAMLGPVGMRCRECGTPARDPLTHLSPAQLGAGAAVALGAGTLGALIALRIGLLLALLVGFFAGGLMADAVLRVTGYKRGPVMVALVVGGIVGGLVIAVALTFGSLLVHAADAGLPLGFLLDALAPDWLLYTIAALVGGIARLR